MHNKHFKIGTVPHPLNDLIGKFLEYVKNARNCTFKEVIPDDGLWGNCYGKNNCSGMIGLVDRKEVDFAIGSI